MSRVKERLKQYKLDLEKQTQYKQGLPGSALDIVNTLLADLEEDERKTVGFQQKKNLQSMGGIWLLSSRVKRFILQNTESARCQ